MGFSCFFGGLSYSLHMSLCSLLQHALSQRLGGSSLWIAPSTCKDDISASAICHL